MQNVTVTYHGHACFTLCCNGYTVAIDPYKDGMVPGLPELSLEADAVYCSHAHEDHAYTQAVKLISGASACCFVESLETFHDDARGTLRGKNLIHIFDFDGMKIAHLGDLGEIPPESVLQKLQGMDCMMIPVGGFYTIDPETAGMILKLTKPRIAVPMHYRTDSTGFGVLHHLDDFTGLFAHTEQCDNSFTLTKDAPSQILVVKYNP